MVCAAHIHCVMDSACDRMRIIAADCGLPETDADESTFGGDSTSTVIGEVSLVIAISAQPSMRNQQRTLRHSDHFIHSLRRRVCEIDDHAVRLHLRHELAAKGSKSTFRDAMRRACDVIVEEMG